MSVGAWTVMLGPVSGAVVVAGVGSVGAVTDGIAGGGVVGVPGSWQMYGGVGAGASLMLEPGWAATHACFHAWL